MIVRNDFLELMDGVLLKFGLGVKEWFVLFSALFFMLLIDFLREKKNLMNDFLKQNSIFKWMCSVLLALAIIVFGVYGDGYNATDFVYLKF